MQTLPLQQVADLMRPGQPLPFKVLDAQGRLLLAEGQPVVDVQQLRALLERGACVVQQEADAVRAARGAGVATGPTYSARQLTWFDRWERHLWAIDDTLRDVSKGAGSAAALRGLADQQQALVAAQPDAALFSLLRQNDLRYALYAVSHARHTALVVQLAAGVQAWPAARVRTAVLAALTMNTSTVELQARMAEQAEPPTRKQLEQLREHPLRSAALLRAAGVGPAPGDDDWLRAVEQHHEQPGGGGYPAGLAEPDEVARLVRAADVYAAKLSPRAFRAPLPSQTAARQLLQEDAASQLAAALIRAVGIYPPGDVVRLKSGEVAVMVTRATAGRGAQAAVLQAASGKAQPGTTRRDTSQADTAVSAVLSAAERAALPRLLPEQVYGLLQAGD